MWNLFNCYLSGHHEYGVWCEPGTIFLRCVHCGKRSSGWSLEATPAAPAPKRSVAGTVTTPPTTTGTVRRVLPFDRAVAR